MIYFIQEKNDKEFVKIGVTTLRMDRRLTNLQVGNPRELEIVLVLKGMYDLEHKLHRYFSDEHVRGEWFRCSPRLQAFIDKPFELPSKVDKPIRRLPKAMFTWE